MFLHEVLPYCANIVMIMEGENVYRCGVTICNAPRLNLQYHAIKPANDYPGMFQHYAASVMSTKGRKYEFLSVTIFSVPLLS